MAVWQCTHCGFAKDTRCKPKLCPDCSSKETFAKQEAAQTEKPKK